MLILTVLIFYLFLVEIPCAKEPPGYFVTAALAIFCVGAFEPTFSRSINIYFAKERVEILKKTSGLLSMRKPNKTKKRIKANNEFLM